MSTTRPAKSPPPVGAKWHPHSHKLVEWSPVGVLVTRPWPNPRAWACSARGNGHWRPAAGNPWVEAWGPAPAEPPGGRLGARLAAWRTVPQEIQQAVLASTVLEQEWRMLNLLARCPGALELAQSVPLLAGALSIANYLRRTPVARPHRSARALLAGPEGMVRWRKIALWLGFDGSRAFVNLLRRATRARAWSELDLAALREVWAHPLGRKRLCHAPRVDQDVVQLLRAAIGAGYIERLRVELVNDAYAGGGWGGAARHLERAAAAWQRCHGHRALPQWRSAEELEADALRLHQAISESALRAPGTVFDFPPPPLPAPPGIRPLDSPQALAAEAGAMGHCLANGAWERLARGRQGYAYAVEVAGERGTVWIRRAPTGSTGFAVAQLQGPGNTTPAPAVVSAVATWESAWKPTDAAPLPSAWAAVAWIDDDDDIPF